jgi:hypothetical protein
MINEVAFEQIQGKYYYGAYGPFRVIMMKDSGYINATKMCKSGGKQFKSWTRLNGSTELIQAVQNKLVLENSQDSLQDSNLPLGDLSAQICADRSFACKTIAPANCSEVDRLISGTYCHPLLIPHIACWISPTFAIMVSEVVNGYITSQYKTQLDGVRLELAGNQYALIQATELQEAATMTAFLAQQRAQQLEEVIQDKEHQHQVWSSSHAFTMLRLNSVDAKRPYYAIRCKRSNMCGAINKIVAKHPASIKVYQNAYVPNPINLYNRLKTSGILQFEGNYCSSLVGEAELISKLGNLCTIIIK